MSGKLLISLSILKDNFAVQSILGWCFFPFSSFNILCHFLLAYRVCAEKSNRLMYVSSYLASCFSLVAFFFLKNFLMFIFKGEKKHE